MLATVNKDAVNLGEIDPSMILSSSVPVSQKIFVTNVSRDKQDDYTRCRRDSKIRKILVTSTADTA